MFFYFIFNDFYRSFFFFLDGTLPDDITNKILYMLCKDIMLFSTVEKKGFRCLMKKVAPLYTMPSAFTITKKFENKYFMITKDFKEKLKKALWYCLTCDNWSDVSMAAYMGITCYYLEEDYTWQSQILGCFPLEGRHDNVNLKNVILKVFDSFEIKIEKITCMVSDDEAAIKKACQFIVGKEKHLVCAVHEISHLVPDTLISMKKEQQKSENVIENQANEIENNKQSDNILAIIEKLYSMW